MGADCITCAIADAADRITAFRLVRLLEQGELTMALELKGLKAESVAARAHHARLLQAYRSFNVAAPAHAAEVEGLSEEITEMSSDLAFAVGLGGNGGGSGAATEGKEKPADPPKGEEPKTEQANPEPPQVQQTPGAPLVASQPNFHE